MKKQYNFYTHYRNYYRYVKRFVDGRFQFIDLLRDSPYSWYEYSEIMKLASEVMDNSIIDKSCTRDIIEDAY